MARNRVHIHATPQEVFAVLSDPHRYPEWVVGAAGLRDYGEDFPAVGSRFHHKVGSWPVGLNDHTEVLEHDPPRRIVLKAKARPLGTATIVIDLVESAGGTELTMEEVPGRPTYLARRRQPGCRHGPAGPQRRGTGPAEAAGRRRPRGGPDNRALSRRPAGADHRRQQRHRVGRRRGAGREGAEIALLARNELGLAAAKRRLAESGAEAVTVAADVTDHEALAAGIEKAVAELGGLDVLVTSAGEPLLRPLHRDRQGRFRSDDRDGPRRHDCNDPRGASPPRALARRRGGRRLDRRPDAAAGDGRLHDLKARPRRLPRHPAYRAGRGRLLGDAVAGQSRRCRHPALEHARKLDRPAAARTPSPGRLLGGVGR